MKDVFFILSAFLMLSCQGNKYFQLDHDHADQLCILVDEEPTVSAAFAARELQYHIKKSTGIELAIDKG